MSVYFVHANVICKSLLIQVSNSYRHHVLRVLKCQVHFSKYFQNAYELWIPVDYKVINNATKYVTSYKNTLFSSGEVFSKLTLRLVVPLGPKGSFSILELRLKEI